MSNWITFLNSLIVTRSNDFTISDEYRPYRQPALIITFFRLIISFFHIFHIIVDHTPSYAILMFIIHKK